MSDEHVDHMTWHPVSTALPSEPLVTRRGRTEIVAELTYRGWISCISEERPIRRRIPAPDAWRFMVE